MLLMQNIFNNQAVALFNSYTSRNRADNTVNTAVLPLKKIVQLMIFIYFSTLSMLIITFVLLSKPLNRQINSYPIFPGIRLLSSPLALFQTAPCEALLPSSAPACFYSSIASCICCFHVTIRSFFTPDVSLPLPPPKNGRSLLDTVP